MGESDLIFSIPFLNKVVRPFPIFLTIQNQHDDVRTSLPRFSPKTNSLYLKNTQKLNYCKFALAFVPVWSMFLVGGHSSNLIDKITINRNTHENKNTLTSASFNVGSGY